MQIAHRTVAYLVACCALGAFALLACGDGAVDSRPAEGVLAKDPTGEPADEPAGGDEETDAPDDTTPEPTTSEKDASSDPSTPGKKALAEDCTKDDDCESGICHIGGKASYCTLACTPENAPDVCVAPFDGRCNNQGRCRRPD